MPEIPDGESVEMKGSAKQPYILKNTGGVYSCSCPAWRNQSLAIEKRTCKHLKKYRGEAAETARVGAAATAAKPAKKEAEAKEGPPLLLAHRWENDVDLAGWWMSEKLDGVRAYWTGNEFLSRLGNVYHAPDWFIEKLPDFPLDGELWIDRGQFQRTVSVARRQDKSDHWKEMRFLVFDAPEMSDPFEERLAFLSNHFQREEGYAAVLQHELCRGLEHLKQELLRVEELGGEGLMLRQPGSRYEAGRSTSLLKVKTFLDAEGKVIDHTAGRGRHKGRVGALVVEMPGGETFSVGTGLSDKDRENPPPIGSMVTYRYQELTDGGIPRFPSFVGVRSTAEATTEVKKKPKAAQPEPAKSKPAASSSGFRRFEFKDAKSEKFWEIACDDCDVTVKFGRIGTAGQTKTKTLADEAKAEKHYEKLVEEKTGKGYEEIG